MNQEEAIEILKKNYPKTAKKVDGIYVGGFDDVDCEFGQALTIAISSLTKQIPNKIKEERWIDTKCDCGYTFSVHHGDGYYSIPKEKKTKYCPMCGQALAWSV
nr:MAG TPA: hydrogenase/urease nickel incorporation protein [Caudoviricetes sp.]